MTHEEMRAKSASKVQQIKSLMKVLNINIDAHQVMDQKTGIIKIQPYFVDLEKYPEDVAAEIVNPAPDVPLA